jgi:hypothetical protein
MTKFNSSDPLYAVFSTVDEVVGVDAGLDFSGMLIPVNTSSVLSTFALGRGCGKNVSIEVVVMAICSLVLLKIAAQSG